MNAEANPEERKVTPDALEAKPQTRQRWSLKSKLIVIAIVIAMLHAVYIVSPLTSPFASIRDTDSDGVSDARDESWLDSTKWNNARADIYIEIGGCGPVFYEVYFNGNLFFKSRSHIDTSMNTALSITYGWEYGKVSNLTLEVTLRYLTSSPIDKSTTIQIVNGGDYHVNLIY